MQSCEISIFAKEKMNEDLTEEDFAKVQKILEDFSRYCVHTYLEKAGSENFAVPANFALERWLKPLAPSKGKQLLSEWVADEEDADPVFRDQNLMVESLLKPEVFAKLKVDPGNTEFKTKVWGDKLKEQFQQSEKIKDAPRRFKEWWKKRKDKKASPEPKKEKKKEKVVPKGGEQKVGLWTRLTQGKYWDPKDRRKAWAIVKQIVYPYEFHKKDDNHESYENLFRIIYTNVGLTKEMEKQIIRYKKALLYDLNHFLIGKNLETDNKRHWTGGDAAEDLKAWVDRWEQASDKKKQAESATINELYEYRQALGEIVKMIEELQNGIEDKYGYGTTIRFSKLELGGEDLDYEEAEEFSSSSEVAAAAASDSDVPPLEPLEEEAAEQLPETKAEKAIVGTPSSESDEFSRDLALHRERLGALSAEHRTQLYNIAQGLKTQNRELTALRALQEIASPRTLNSVYTSEQASLFFDMCSFMFKYY